MFIKYSLPSQMCNFLTLHKTLNIQWKELSQKPVNCCQLLRFPFLSHQSHLSGDLGLQAQQALQTVSNNHYRKDGFILHRLKKKKRGA